MDCIDCHNRPSHRIAATPERAVNDAMARGDIPATLPFVHREAVKVLKARYASPGGRGRGNCPALAGVSTATQPAVACVARRRTSSRRCSGSQDLYHRNVFPEMKVAVWDYPNNIGHVDSPGCFRCHDDNHKAKDGKKIGQDCETCHAIE